MAGTIKLDFDPLMNYFKSLSLDMIIAWSLFASSLILIAVGVFLIL